MSVFIREALDSEEPDSQLRRLNVVNYSADYALLGPKAMVYATCFLCSLFHCCNSIHSLPTGCRRHIHMFFYIWHILIDVCCEAIADICMHILTECQLFFIVNMRLGYILHRADNFVFFFCIIKELVLLYIERQQKTPIF